MSERMQEYLASRTLYSELTGVLLRLAQQKFEEERKDLTEAFGKEIASIGLYTSPQTSWVSLGILRFVSSELQSRALIEKSFEIAGEKWKAVFGETLDMPKINKGVDNELKAALSFVVMSETKSALPELGPEENLILKRIGVRRK